MGKDLFVCQIYVHDIIFGSTNKFFYDVFSKIMMNMFEMSMMRDSHSFLNFKLSKSKREPSLAKRSILVTYSKSLAWTKQILSRRPWAVMIILILIWAAHRLIKRYITT
jgi:hypothetical protein